VAATVYAINPASPEAHRKYVDQKDFNFKILSDAEREAAAQYRALKENGKSIERSVYVIDKAGKIAFARRGMPADKDILASIKP